MEINKFQELTGNIPEAAAVTRVESVFVKLGGIDWLVLDVENGKALLLSEEILEQRQYNTEEVAIAWEQCTLRKYLNGEFYDSLGADKPHIAETRNDNPDNLWYGTSGGNATTDKIFLLSIEEVDKYFGNNGDYANERRKNGNGKPESDGYLIDNAYNKDRIAKYGNEGDSWWWLRSPGLAPNDAAFVGFNGAVFVLGFNVCDRGGVRPALWLNLQESPLSESGDEQLDGYSEYKNADGILYKGNFADGKLYGKAKVFAPNGDFIYEGVFSGDNPETAIFDIANVLCDEGDYEAIYKFASVLAECKIPRGINFLGVLYSDGYYVQEDLEKAFNLFAEAAELGEARGNYNLGWMYYYGESVEQDYSKAFDCFSEAADADVVAAYYYLGEMYYYGYGVPRDYSKAFDYFSEADNVGDAEATYYLGEMYYYGEGVERDDDSKAFEYFSKAADAGYAEAYFMLGKMRYFGWDAPPDSAKAAEAWKTGAEQGSFACQEMLRELESATAT